MSYVDFCLIADHNSDRRNGLKDKITSYNLSKDIVQAINCGHGLLYLNQWSEKVVGKQVVVILNSKTPIMGGLEFIRELKKGEIKHNTEKVKIVVMTEGLSTEDKKEYKAQGIADFMDCNLEDENFELQLKDFFQKPSIKRVNVVKPRVKKTESGFHDLESKQVYMIPNTQAG